MRWHLHPHHRTLSAWDLGRVGLGDLASIIHMSNRVLRLGAPRTPTRRQFDVDLLGVIRRRPSDSDLQTYPRYAYVSGCIRPAVAKGAVPPYAYSIQCPELVKDVSDTSGLLYCVDRSNQFPSEHKIGIQRKSGMRSLFSMWHECISLAWSAVTRAPTLLTNSQ